MNMGGNLRYTVLFHGGTARPHFDLLIEKRPGSLLASWRSPVWPIEIPTKLTRIEDHRRLYLDFDGPLTDGRGFVKLVTTGNCRRKLGKNPSWTIPLSPQSELILTPLDGDKWRAECCCSELNVIRQNPNAKTRR